MFNQNSKDYNKMQMPEPNTKDLMSQFVNKELNQSIQITSNSFRVGHVTFSTKELTKGQKRMLMDYYIQANLLFIKEKVRKLVQRYKRKGGILNFESVCDFTKFTIKKVNGHHFHLVQKCTDNRKVDFKKLLSSIVDIQCNVSLKYKKIKDIVWNIEFSCLKIIDLSQCSIESVQGIVFNQFSSLQHLILNSNKIFSLKPFEKSSFKNLAKITLFDNHIQEMRSFTKSHIPKLESFHLDRTRIALSPEPVTQFQQRQQQNQIFRDFIRDQNTASHRIQRRKSKGRQMQFRVIVQRIYGLEEREQQAWRRLQWDHQNAVQGWQNRVQRQRLVGEIQQYEGIQHVIPRIDTDNDDILFPELFPSRENVNKSVQFLDFVFKLQNRHSFKQLNLGQRNRIQQRLILSALLRMNNGLQIYGSEFTNRMLRLELELDGQFRR